MKKFYVKLLSATMALSVFSLVSFTFAGCTNKTVPKAENTDYVILMITDLHLENKAGYLKRAFKTVDDLVKISNPDLIIATGDINEEKESNDVIFKAFGEKMESYKIPWTFAFGNHDAEGSAWSKKDIADYLESLEYCLFEKGSDEVYGYGNNYFNVKDENGKIIQTIFTLDSTGEEGGTHHIEQSQLDWYESVIRDVATETNGDPSVVVPSIIFTHVPMKEYKEAYDEAEQKGEIVFGKRHEKECPNETDDMMLETIVSLGSTTAYYCGHEHRNNYVVYKDGIRLTYGETCRHKFYIPTRGGTVINVKKDGTVTQQNIRRAWISATYKISEEY